MPWAAIADTVATIALLLGALLALIAAIGVVRFSDLLARMHAATKPQALGLLLIVFGLGLRLRSPEALGMLALIALFQLTTAPVSAHMIGRTAFRTLRMRRDLLLVDELSPRLSESEGTPPDPEEDSDD